MFPQNYILMNSVYFMLRINHIYQFNSRIYDLYEAYNEQNYYAYFKNNLDLGFQISDVPGRGICRQRFAPLRGIFTCILAPPGGGGMGTLGFDSCIMSPL